MLGAIHNVEHFSVLQDYHAVFSEALYISSDYGNSVWKPAATFYHTRLYDFFHHVQHVVAFTWNNLSSYLSMLLLLQANLQALQQRALSRYFLLVYQNLQISGKHTSRFQTGTTHPFLHYPPSLSITTVAVRNTLIFLIPLIPLHIKLHSHWPASDTKSFAGTPFWMVKFIYV